MDDFLTLVKPVSWPEVFASWRHTESSLPRWIEHYQSRGFSSWDEWRNDTFKDLPYASLIWNLYEIQDPVAHVPHFYGGPFRTWEVHYYDGATRMTFDQIIVHKDLQESTIIKGMLANFPSKTTLIGLSTPHGIVIIEGMHRALTLALAARKGVAISSKVFIALAKFRGTLHDMGQVNSPT